MKQQFMAISEDGERLTDVDLQSLNTKYYQNTGALDAYSKPIYFGSLIEFPGDPRVYQVVWKLKFLGIGIVSKNLLDAGTREESPGISRSTLSRCKIVGHISDPVVSFQHPQEYYVKIVRQLLNGIPLGEAIEIVRDMFNFSPLDDFNIDIGGDYLKITFHGRDSQPVIDYKELAVVLTAYVNFPKFGYFKFGKKSAVKYLIYLGNSGFQEDITRTNRLHDVKKLEVFGGPNYRVGADGQEMSLYELCDFILDVIGVQCG